MLRAIVAGNLGADAQLKDVNGQSVCEFSVASGRKDRSGREVTTWVRCSLWGKRGQTLAQYLVRGTKVTVVGELAAGAYVGQDGQARASLDLRVDDVALMGGAPQRAAAQPAPAAPRPAPAPRAYAAPTYAPAPAPQASPAPQPPQADAYDEIPF